MTVIPSSKLTTLENGLRVITEEIPVMRSVAVGLLVGAGSGHETKPESGISHVIEHMSFKGTEKRSAHQIAHELDAVGGKINAYTSKEVTMYYAMVLDKHIDTALDVLSDILLNSKFDSAALEMENGTRINVVSSGLVEDSVDKYEAYFPGHNPIPMSKVVNAYVKSVEGKLNGEIITIYDNC